MVFLAMVIGAALLAIHAAFALGHTAGRRFERDRLMNPVRK